MVAPVGADVPGPHVGPGGWGLTLRILDLDDSVALLSSHHVAVEVDPEPYPNGRFAQLADPEGNPIQLWQPT